MTQPSASTAAGLATGGWHRSGLYRRGMRLTPSAMARPARPSRRRAGAATDGPPSRSPARCAYSGTPSNLIEPIRQAAEKDLGFAIFFEPGAARRGLGPGEGRHTTRVVRRPLRAPQPPPTGSGRRATCSRSKSRGYRAGTRSRRSTSWARSTPAITLPKTVRGRRRAISQRLRRSGPVRAMDDANRAPCPELDGVLVEWLDEATEQGRGDEPAFSSMVPGVLGADSCRDTTATSSEKEPQEISWAELLNSSWRGRVGLGQPPKPGIPRDRYGRESARPDGFRKPR